MKNKQHYSNLLSDTDKNSIVFLLNRKPTILELELIAAIKQRDIRIRPYLQTLARLDRGARRNETENISLDDRHSLIGVNGNKIFNRNGNIIIGDDIALRKIICNGNEPLIHVIETSVNNERQEHNIKKSISQARAGKPISIGGYQQSTEIEKMPIVSSAIFGTQSENKEPSATAESDTILYLLETGKSWTLPSSDRKIKSLVKTLNNRPWFYGLTPVGSTGLGDALLALCRESGLGIQLSIENIEHHKIVSTLSEGKLDTVILAVQNGFHKEVNSTLDTLNINYRHIGELNKSIGFLITQGGKKIVSLPLNVFDFVWHAMPRMFPKIQNREIEHSIIRRPPIPSDFNTVFKKLITEINFRRKRWHLKQNRSSSRVMTSDYSVSAQLPNPAETLIVTTADNDYYTTYQPRIAGRLTVANAMRQCVCCGAVPTSLTIHTILPDAVESDEYWKGVEVLQGQEEAVRVFNIPISNRNILPYKNLCSQHVSVAGVISKHSSEISRAFVSEGDFITMIGSHRGELGGSAYFRDIANIRAGTPPTVDLGMETRLQDVMLQGNRTGLIRSASTVSEGGIAVAIAESLLSSEEGVGARIHLTRKIRNDELMFGETQGLIIVTLKESDIMEFERICMSVGVPSTTIGRVTGTGVFSFNNKIRIEVKDLQTVYQ